MHPPVSGDCTVRTGHCGPAWTNSPPNPSQREPCRRRIGEKTGQGGSHLELPIGAAADAFPQAQETEAGNAEWFWSVSDHVERWRYDDRVRPDLRESDFREADLKYVYLANADLRGANLEGADLLGADLRGANLQGVVIRRTHLAGADLRNAVLRETDLGPVNLAARTPRRCSSRIRAVRT